MNRISFSSDESTVSAKKKYIFQDKTRISCATAGNQKQEEVDFNVQPLWGWVEHLYLSLPRAITTTGNLESSSFSLLTTYSHLLSLFAFCMRKLWSDGSWRTGTACLIQVKTMRLAHTMLNINFKGRVNLHSCYERLIWVPSVACGCPQRPDREILQLWEERG